MMNEYRKVVGATVLFRYGDSHLYGEVIEINEDTCKITLTLDHRIRTLQIPIEDILHWYRIEED